MSVDFGAGRTAGIGKLRAGAALALVMAAASLAPAYAQAAPQDAAAGPVASDDDQPPRERGRDHRDEIGRAHV